MEYIIPMICVGLLDFILLSSQGKKETNEPHKPEVRRLNRHGSTINHSSSNVYSILSLYVHTSSAAVS